MLIKEYRIPLPLTVEEYRIAQLYMIAKKSREESRGAGNGVEILVNEPYTNGPGGSGQYTHKIFHVGSHLPGWFKGLLPKSALIVEEKAWNAYPYTKTRYLCPFVEKFSLEIETRYLSDCGSTENVFNLSNADLRARLVDPIDVVKDQLYGGDYKSEEDPKLYLSQKTNRGPLSESWLDDYRDAKTNGHNKDIMCAYKLCRVEFKYWGMQSKIEKFIHDMALRKTMLRAHRQAWAWQDEWFGLTMDDIRRLERETQEALAKKMCSDGNSPSTVVSSPIGSQTHLEDRTDSDDKVFEDNSTVRKPNGDVSESTPRISPSWPSENSPKPHKPSELRISTDDGESNLFNLDKRQKNWIRSNRSLHSPGGSSTKSFDIQIASLRMGSCVQNSESSSDDEFFDCEGGKRDLVFSH